MSKRPREDQIESIIQNNKTKERYLREEILGNGAFAKCYKLKNIETDKAFAGKIVSKPALMKHKNSTNMVYQEITIHRTLSHPHIVSFHSSFEDDLHVYIIMELCQRKSFEELLSRRKTLTIPEVRYYMRQIALACKYLHENKVIHRDLKPRNLFISDDMTIKIGDFGLATCSLFKGDRKKTVCGTPSYIAPEVLNNVGYSFEVDIWALGCIMYTFLVGFTPFEFYVTGDETREKLYSNIKTCYYYLPKRMEPNARQLISSLLRVDPSQRPNADAILKNPFFAGYIPSTLSTNCLTNQPEHNKSFCDGSTDTELEESEVVPLSLNLYSNSKSVPPEFYLKNLLEMLNNVCESILKVKFNGDDLCSQDPASLPSFWVSRWVNENAKYGFIYQLCDNSVCFLFNDSTRLTLFSDQKHLLYNDKNDEEYHHTLDCYPVQLYKKVLLLNYLDDFMKGNLVNTGKEVIQKNLCIKNTPIPYVQHFSQTKKCFICLLSNGTVQLDFKDNTKLILCSLRKSVTAVYSSEIIRTYSFELINKFGCAPFLAENINEAKVVVEYLLSLPRNLLTSVKMQ